MTQDILIRAEQLYRYYSGHCAVKNVSFDVRRGEILGFLGPNGAGKTTTMQILAGSLAPSSGQVRINDFDLLDKPKQAKQGLGYLPETPPLYRELTVTEYLAFCARLNRIPRNQQAGAIASAINRCGLKKVSKRLIGNLSKGYQQRVGIAQAIIHSPSVIILDEPTVGLDPIQIREIRELIRELAQKHSVILSTHILPEVQAICDRVQIINQGELVLTDTIAGLSQRMEATSILVRFDAPPTTEALMSIKGVTSVEREEDGRFRLRYQPDKQDPVEELVRRTVDKGWHLRELTPERRTLEEIFVAITQTETSQEPVLL
ncbi:ABC transporter, ATPase subunit [Nitrosococcus oceani ATCC 19707]|uniref:ABC transporter, ATPase subunit n=2 Tax=Nitrosococcus oceani TaxID=1229 RepID=Q3J7U9_NITOC|nr:ATP-binding cassette domain-containing protein [Nitrosococcus oceani]ABA59097.1 ABC transporter, ATPase subunit [Nitrosococcus oceani ATCC 19707]KFI18419.1 ABC transporter ATP-binding protein [Nitrosococcus oceani C-27]